MDNPKPFIRRRDKFSSEWPISVVAADSVTSRIMFRQSNAFAFYKFGHTISEIHVGQRFGRHVDRHTDFQSAFRSPFTAEIHGFTEYQPRELIDVVVLLERPNECVGRHNAFFWWA